LLVGESGTGKELAARLIHTLDSRKDKRELVTLDCTTIVADLAGSEFFGHERGAFTGAAGLREGAFALADRGTLFLDEIGELPLPLQAQLLRVIQERQYKRVGGNGWHATDFRLISATNRDLQAEVAAGRFRQDLYFRLAACTFTLPSLGERPDDIPVLAEHFVAEQQGAAVPMIGQAVKDFLVQRDYPGNVRELRQLVARICSRHVGDGPITIGDIPHAERPAQSALSDVWRDDALETAIRRAICRGAKLKEIGHAATEAAIRIMVDEEEGNLQRAARRLGVTDRTLQIRRANGSSQAPKVGGE
ncbi:MAG: sigma 54-interacting transcriptional regulator, partial [Alphaproteobacteria bacterium]|nr:sigma 54-interacting transcriptional regulator [Alphaproteobacteria bacterium]